MFNPGAAADIVASGALYALGLIGLVGCVVKAMQALTVTHPHGGARPLRRGHAPSALN